MRKIFVFIIGGFIMFSAFGVGENVPTSKSYIDSELVEKQDTIERTSGNNQALTNTGTAGEYGTKDIYDSTGLYAEQQDALVDAQTMNTAVQNAINAEFVCISWVDDDPSKDCLLMEIRGKTERRSPNLFDVSKIPARVVGGFNSQLVNNGDGSITVMPVAGDSSCPTGKKLSELAPELEVGKRYSLNFNTTGTNKIIYLLFARIAWAKATSKIMTQDMLDSIVSFYGSHPDLTPQTISNIQITEGTTVQPYQPYGNIYLPAGN